MPYPDVVLVGGFALRLWALTGLVGSLVALLATGREARRLGLDPQAAQDALLTLILGAAAGAIVVNPLADRLPVLRFLVVGGPLSPGGALLGLLLAGAFRFRTRPLPLWSFMDAATPGVALGLAVALSGTSWVGRPTTLPWGVGPDGSGPVHPLSLYFILAALGGYLLARLLSRRSALPGQIFLLTVLYGAVARLVMEWVADNPLRLGPFTGPQAVSAAIGVGAWAALRLRERGTGNAAPE